MDELDGYNFPADRLAELLLRRFYPERTDAESAIMRDFLLAHGGEYDGFAFSVRVGKGQPVDPAHLPGVQRATTYNTRKRIDMCLWQRGRLTIAEVKKQIGPGVLGQLRTYRQLFLEEHPEVEDVQLAAIGRFSDPDTLRVLSAEGVDVYLYEPVDGGGGAAA
jgi:hypothetical protein